MDFLINPPIPHPSMSQPNPLLDEEIYGTATLASSLAFFILILHRIEQIKTHPLPKTVSVRQKR